MKQLSLFSLLIITVLVFGCSKSEDSPVGGDSKGNINGVIKNSSTNQPVAGVKVTLTQTSAKTVTDNNGSYSFTGLAEGTYTITASDAGYKTASVANIAVTKGGTATANSSIVQLVWKTASTDNNATVAIPTSLNLNINGVALTAGDAIGCFYDSLGSIACSGFTEISSTTVTAIPVTVWGDDGVTSGKKEGFASGDVINWKVKRKSDGKVFDATALYKTGTGSYQANAIYEITKFTIVTE